MIKKFSVAFNGLKLALSSKSVQLQLFFAILAISVSLIFQFTKTENLILGLCIAIVISLEIVNEAIERLCDRITKEYDSQIKDIKDLSAAAVLVTSLISLVLGIMMIINHI